MSVAVRGLLVCMRPSVPGLMLLAAIVALALTAGSRVQKALPSSPDGTAPVVLELFTSQGCSSCPHADALLARLARDPEIGPRLIPLAFHVDYWNYLGWSDPFSRADWSRRQQAYARSLGSKVYTPQLVVNGHEQMVGSAEPTVRSSIRRAARVAPTVDLQTTISRSGDAITVRVDARRRSEQRDPVVILAALVRRHAETEVPRGENAGQNLKNDFIVEDLRPVCTLEAGAEGRQGTVEFSIGSYPQSVVVLAQSRRTLQILGASNTSISGGSVRD